jgi:UDP-N-acetylmuramoyl-L-alanyl-D-glutamate--2,6-diaminopimelate ligase
MGSIANELADIVFVTSDNPRSEEPQEIIKEILVGCTTPVHSITDRRQAIHEAISHLETGDILLVAGKGHETYQIIGTKTEHFDDREVIRELL